MADKEIEAEIKEDISTPLPGKDIFRNMAVIGIGTFVLMLLIGFYFSERSSAQRLEDVLATQSQQMAKLNSSLDAKQARISQMEAMMDVYKERVSISPGKLLFSQMDVTETRPIASPEWNKDSDFDGLPDDLDSNPASAQETRNIFLAWEYSGKSYHIELEVNEDWYLHAKQKARAFSKEQYVMPTHPLVKETAEKLQKIIVDEGYISYSEFISAFADSIIYKTDEESVGGPYPRFPIETIVDREGDCEDKAYLMASLLLALGIDTVLVDIPEHMALGVACANCQGVHYDFNGRRYYYLEPTSSTYRLGEQPLDYKGAVPILRALNGI